MEQLLTQSVIHADETVVQVLKEDNKPATSESRMWQYASGEYSKQHIHIFEYQPDWSGKRPESFLKGFTRIQPGAESHSLRLLGSCQTEMAGSYAGWRYCKNQQGSSWVPILYEAVLPGEEKRASGLEKEERIPPECGLAPSGGVFCMAENNPIRKRAVNWKMRYGIL